jgi:4-hydroxy-L-threonine phosphate dehydrogenase PdxA
MRDSHLKYEHALESQMDTWAIGKTGNVPDTLDVLRSQCDISLRWTQVYCERTDIRINLVSKHLGLRLVSTILTFEPVVSSCKPTRITYQQGDCFLHSRGR